MSSNSVDADEDVGTVSIYSELSAGHLCTETSIDVIASDGNATCQLYSVICYCSKFNIYLCIT